MAEDIKTTPTNIIDKVNISIEDAKLPESVVSSKTGPNWPQIEYTPLGLLGSNSRGFLPPTLIPITKEGELTTSFNVGSVTIKDWRGVELSLPTESISTRDKFELSRDIPKSGGQYSTRDHYIIFGDQATDYFKHGLHVIDNLTPIDGNLNSDGSSTNLRLKNFTETSYEHNDPVMFGFEIVFDDITSPLLNGSVIDFLNNYSTVNEIQARIPVYEDFKNQFTKFFNTKANVRIDQSLLHVTKKMRDGGYPESENDLNIRQGSKKRSYLNYYLKKIDGLDKLIERNLPDSKNYLQEYNKDIITLTFDEDLSLSFGTLATLYKLLYWSKPNGKGMVPENLLRFNCDIIISEVRNFNRVKKAMSGSNQSEADIQVIKDNVSRYVYTLSECQFYFDQPIHETSIDLANLKVFSDSATVKFDYKFATSKFERWMPYQGNGAYHSYNNGAIWKIGNNRGDNTGSGEDNKRSKSNPSFQNIDVQTSGVPGKDSWGKAANYLPDNTNFIISTTSKQKEEPNNDPATSNEEKTKNSENEALNETPETNTLDDFKKASENAANTAKESLKKASITDISNNLLKQAGLGSVSQLKGSIQASTIDKARAKANAIATGARETMEALLAQELNKIREALNLSGTGLTFQTGNVVPNVYKGATFDNPNYYKDPVSGKTFYNQRLVSPSDVPPQPIGIPYSIKFYDVRAQLTRFVGDSLGDRFYSAGE